MRRLALYSLSLSTLLFFGSSGCSESSASDESTGGSPSPSGGAQTSGTGGTASPSGGAASGGGTSTGGVTASGGAPATGRTRVVGYVPNWYRSYADWVDRIDYSKLTQLNLAFALANNQGHLGLAPDAEVDALVQAAHAAGVQVFPSLCGGGGDDHIAPFYEPDKVDAFVDDIIAYAEAHDMDGIDLDVEAPNRMGGNYDTFVAKLLAKARPKGLPVTAAVSQWMQWGMSDDTLRSFDFVTLMAYDATGTWDAPGPHSSYDQAVEALDYYEERGVAREKLVLGVPFYGYCWGNCPGAGDASYVLYKDIIDTFPDAWNTDWIEQDGAQYSFNGTVTMTQKAQLAADYGGIMIWELEGDLNADDEHSLLKALDDAL